MNVVESRRVRHLVIRAEHGEALPQVFLRALDEAEVKAGWVTGTGVLEAVELASIDPVRARVVRRIEEAVSVVSLVGSVAIEGGETAVRLSATLTREGAFGLETFAGEILSARVVACDLVVTAFDDLSFGRQVDELTGITALVVSSRAQTSALRPVVAEPAPRAPVAAPAPAPAPAPPSPAPAQTESSLSPPVRPAKPREEQPEQYPEVGDLVSHFHFGECEVISSDGERIRLRQEKDGRVREVALTMLKIEAPTTHPSGKRHFRLARKH